MILKNDKKVLDFYKNGKRVLKLYKDGNLIYIYTLDTPITTVGQFTINSNGDKVGFAIGNLLYQASTGLWRFAEHQWDYVGDATYGNVYENGTKCSNTYMSSSYTGWVDLFGFGTSGDNTITRNAYEPYSTSTNNADYCSIDLSISDKTDWGWSYSQQEGEPGWRTLTQPEWEYILKSRSGDRFAKCVIDGLYNCLVIFPDGYSTTMVSRNQQNTPFTSNSLTIEQAEALTNDGCVLLPCGGSRDYSLWNAGSAGYYYTTTLPSANLAYTIKFLPSTVAYLNGVEPMMHCSVRLVKDISN